MAKLDSVQFSIIYELTHILHSNWTCIVGLQSPLCSRRCLPLSAGREQGFFSVQFYTNCAVLNEFVQL